ncbi:MAG: uroporphyrinogen-III C-methyltransferase [Longibaculum muris]|uniref:uroporphyrinogen-III C-methyltransferase n=1 Tax=Longibaculum muris TaxID=1796628 RepID=UPI002E777B18|nr:uroporphyrinogen-III C-methyltransferase [Longibaculum muris]MED9813290.1 uroporphyrinogen-III C-methyltransferase [Longibaculum muris]
MAGKVYLVGGGPGALDLYTLKAMRCIEEADCLVYDRLIDERILNYVKEDCECIYVGKQSHYHTMKQEDINALLVEKAKVYEKVVRLKGGDVFVFGRGGEEALTLYENHIDFEVVPGLSSSIAGLCYGGIPITHRGLSSGFEVVTAHFQNQQDEWDYQRFLNDDLTYVFMMGKAKLSVIVEQLLKVGKNPQTPMALISNATLPNQDACYGTLETILDMYDKHPLPSPLLIVLGQVVSLHTKLDFFTKKPYFQTHVLITTLNGKQSVLTQYFQEQGAMVDQLQLGKIEYIQPIQIPSFDYSVIVLTSQNGVKGFFKWLSQERFDLRQLSHARFACIGQKTEQVLNQYGFYSDILSHQANSIAFNLDLKKYVHDDEHMIVICEKSHCAIERLHETDQYISVYENKEIEINVDKHYDLACFTCASSVQRLSQQACTFEKALSIGPMTTKAIRQYYPDVEIIEASHSSYQGMIEKMEGIKDVL